MKMVKINTLLSYTVLLFAGLLFVTSSCKKEEIDVTELEEVIEETELMTFSVSGIIVDESNTPVENVQVHIDDNLRTTDKNGFYHFEDINAQGVRAQVQFTHADYFKSYKTTEVNDGGRFYVNTMLSLLKNPKTVPSDQGGEVFSQSGVRINFPANAFVKADGSNYNGNVNVYFTNLDPTAADIANRFPSDFEILSAEKKKQLMQVYTGVGVELYADAGEPLQINKTVSIEFPLPNDLVSSAPSSIVLGHYNEALGIWEEDGTATLSGSSYVAEVNHFSYWCCLVMQDPTRIWGFVIEDLNDSLIGLPIKDLFVEVSLTNSTISGFTRTGASGFFSLKVPMGLDLEVKIYANSFDVACGTPVHATTLSALTGPHDLGNIIIDAPEMTTITGTVQDCSQQNLSSGYVLLTNQDGNILVTYIEPDGDFYISLYSCNDQVKLVAYDINFTTSSEAVVIPDTESDVILGNLLACAVVTDPPYLMKIITGGDTLIGSSTDGFINNGYDSDGNITTLVYAYFDIDIQNTSQDLNEGSAGIVINITGVENEACMPGYCEFVVPLKDAEADSYFFRIDPTNPNYSNTWIQTYNCINGADYLHFEGEGVLVQSGTGEVVTHRDSAVAVDVYFPL